MTNPAVPPLPDVARLTTYVLNNEMGPFDVGFDIYGDGTDYTNWIEVWLDGTLTQAGWVLTSPTGQLARIPRPITDARITFNARQTGTLRIVGARRPRRLAQLTESQGVPARSFNQVVSDIWAVLRETWDRLSRTLAVPHGETVDLLPPAADRATTVLGFNAAGDVQMYTLASLGGGGGGGGSGNVTGPGGSPGTSVAGFNGSGAMIRVYQGIANSVVGRSTNTTGEVGDIDAASNHQVLRRSGMNIGFGAIDLSQSAAVTGNLGIAHLNSGASASGTTFWRGDGTWASPTIATAALTKADDTNVTLTLGGSPTTALANAASITAGWTGTLSVARGGSGAGTLTGLLQGTGTSAFTAISNSTTAGQVLRVTGSATYGWGALDLSDTDAVTGDLPLTNLEQIATARFLGRTTASTGNIEQLTATQATAMLDAFTGDSGSGGVKGLVPAPAAGDTSAGKFLKSNGTWVAPAGGGDVLGPAGADDNAVVRFDGLTGKLLQNSALLVADTTGALARNGGGGIAVQGTSTNDNASSGYIGEFTSATRASTGVSLTTNVSADVLSSPLSLTAGDWDVEGFVWYAIGAGATTTIVQAWVASASVTRPTPPSEGHSQFRGSFDSNAEIGLATGTKRFSLSSTTSIYLGARGTFTGGTCNAYGLIRARRVR